MKPVCIFFCLIFSGSSISAQQVEGIVSQSAGSAQGYVLFSPLYSKTTYLIDKCGTRVHSWTSNYAPAQSVYLLPDGSILRPCNDSLSSGITAVGGRIERFDWDNKLLWSYSIANELERQHHDVYPMPNGHVLALVYRKRSKMEALDAGRSLTSAEPYLLDEKIVEIKPVGKDSGRVVWEWDVWDHLVEDVDPTLPGYGAIAQNPQLFNINYVPSPGQDWLHFNSISYNAALDQILVSNHEFSEIFIIDHSTTTAQAASHRGGKYGKGGDILYRWGNPAAYNAGTPADQKLFRQHNAHWIAKGRQDEGKIMIFNNGTGRQGPTYSTVDIITPPVDHTGNYTMEPGAAVMPLSPSWSYKATDPSSFYSRNISGAQRLANGNTLICAGQVGKFFEIDGRKKIVWVFINRAGMPVNNNTNLSTVRGVPVFRSTFYDLAYPAFAGRKLAPCAPMEINPVADHHFSKHKPVTAQLPGSK